MRDDEVSFLITWPFSEVTLRAMYISKALLLLFFLAGISSVYASPFRGKTTLGVAAKVNARGTTNIAEADRARAKALREGRLNKRDVIIGITNGQTIYTVKVGVGSPPTECECSASRIPLYSFFHLR